MSRRSHRPRPLSDLPPRGEWVPLESFTWDDEDTRVKTAELPATLHTPGGSRGGYPTAEEVEAAMRATRRLSATPRVTPREAEPATVRSSSSPAPYNGPVSSSPSPIFAPTRAPISAGPDPLSAPTSSSAAPISSSPAPVSAPVSSQRAPIASSPLPPLSPLPVIRAIAPRREEIEARRRAVRSIALLVALVVPVAVGLAYVTQ